MNRRGTDGTPALLHNSGWGGPQAVISWRGWHQSGSADGRSRVERAGTTGTWLNLRHSISMRNCSGGRDWNNARALLRVLDSDHGLAEEDARRALLERIESRCRALEWPACLVADPPKQSYGRDELVFDEPLTAFVALSKSTGSLWMRERQPRLAPLHAPLQSVDTGTRMLQILWTTRLRFPHGVPETLLTALRTRSGTGQAPQPA